jgi:hypothetical protein
VLTAMIAPCAAMSIGREWTEWTDFQDTHGLYTYVRAHPDALILPDLMFEPTLRYYTQHDPAPPPRLAFTMNHHSAPMESREEALAVLGAATRPVVNQHIWLQIHLGQIYPAYARWLMRQGRGEPDVIVAQAQVLPAYAAIIAAEATQQGCAIKARYRSRGVDALRMD